MIRWSGHRDIAFRQPTNRSCDPVNSYRQLIESSALNGRQRVWDPFHCFLVRKSCFTHKRVDTVCANLKAMTIPISFRPVDSEKSRVPRRATSDLRTTFVATAINFWLVFLRATQVEILTRSLLWNIKSTVPGVYRWTVARANAINNL
jgi:hypothetical protein